MSWNFFHLIVLLDGKRGQHIIVEKWSPPELIDALPLTDILVLLIRVQAIIFNGKIVYIVKNKHAKI